MLDVFGFEYQAEFMAQLLGSAKNNGKSFSRFRIRFAIRDWKGQCKHSAKATLPLWGQIAKKQLPPTVPKRINSAAVRSSVMPRSLADVRAAGGGTPE
jgi:hypothetical protein